MLLDFSPDLLIEALCDAQRQPEGEPSIAPRGIEAGLGETSARPRARSAERTSSLSSLRVPSSPDQFAGRSVHSAY